MGMAEVLHWAGLHGLDSEIALFPYSGADYFKYMYM